MKTECLLAVLLLAYPLLGHAADASAPAPAARAPGTNSLAALNAGVEQMMAAYAKTTDCLRVAAALRADLDAKRASLSAEFKGAIPIAFDDLLWQKTARINRTHQNCVQQYDALGRQFEALEMAIRVFEPKSTNIKRQTDLVAAQKSKFLALRPTTKTSAKTKKTDSPR